MSQDIKNKLPCGHPAECADEADENGDCLWCDEVAQLTNDVKALTSVLEDKAVIVEKGADVSIEGPIGYLKVSGGTVTVGDRKTKTFLDAPFK